MPKPSRTTMTEDDVRRIVLAALQGSGMAEAAQCAQDGHQFSGQHRRPGMRIACSTHCLRCGASNPEMQDGP